MKLPHKTIRWVKQSLSIYTHRKCNYTIVYISHDSQVLSSQVNYVWYHTTTRSHDCIYTHYQTKNLLVISCSASHFSIVHAVRLYHCHIYHFTAKRNRKHFYRICSVRSESNHALTHFAVFWSILFRADSSSVLVMWLLELDLYKWLHRGSSLSHDHPRPNEIAWQGTYVGMLTGARAVLSLFSSEVVSLGP